MYSSSFSILGLMLSLNTETFEHGSNVSSATNESRNSPFASQTHCNLMNLAAEFLSPIRSIDDGMGISTHPMTPQIFGNLLSYTRYSLNSSVIFLARSLFGQLMKNPLFSLMVSRRRLNACRHMCSDTLNRSAVALTDSCDVSSHSAIKIKLVVDRGIDSFLFCSSMLGVSKRTSDCNGITI